MSSDDPYQWQNQVEFCRRFYEQTGNPAHVWRAYQICSAAMRRQGDVTLPEWVVAYFDRVSPTVADLYDGCEHSPAGIAQALSAALGFTTPGQGTRETAVSAYRHDMRKWLLAMQMRRERHQRPAVSLEAIVSEIASREQISERAVWRAWEDWKAFIS